MGAVFNGIAKDFADVSLRAATKIKVGIVGEIYVKYSSLGNNSLEDFLAAEGCEVNMPGMMGFLQYCIHNSMYDVDIYGGSNLKRRGYAMLLSYLSKRQDLMIQAIEANTRFIAPHSFDDLAETASKYIGLGAKMGEGWLLTGEMVELVHAGYPNIICAQPFGCLPNHVVGKGMIAKIRDANPEANIMPIDYDPGASKVNQENRIKLMLASAERSMNAAIGKPAQNAPAQGTELVSRWQSI
jgi:predicted nucleotide-binding protein (sugar kinase/HSP70/actin superfamily)